MNPSIQLNPKTDPSFFNAYMSFKLPDVTTKKIDTAKKNIEKKEQSETKEKRRDLNFLEKKEAVVDILKKGNSIKGTIQKVIAPGIETQHVFTDKKGSEITFYTNKKNLPTEEDYTKEAYLQLEDTIYTDAATFFDPVGVYVGDKLIGYVKVTAFSVSEKEALKENNTNISKEDIVKSEEKDILNPTNVPQPTETNDELFDRLTLDRKTLLDNNVTQEQIDAAEAWVRESPLFSDKNGPSVQHVANIVNSNAYAQFVVAGKNLSDVTVLVNAATGGNMVDVYHEAWHTFSQLYLTPKQKIKLYNEVRNSNPKYKDLSFLELEEIIAEDFRTYALKGKTKKDSPARNSIFRSILNFIKKLLNITTTTATNKDTLFQNLYFAGKNPKLLNNYTPLIDNVMFDILNRGVERVGNKKEDSLNRQDGNIFSAAMDSIASELIDSINTKESARRLAQGQAESKSGTIQLLLNPKNKEIVYEMMKNEMQSKLVFWKEKLGSIAVKPFNELTTSKDLEINSIASITDVDGISKYVFLNSQVDDFDNLNLSIKDGDRLKGQTYQGVDIIADYYEHKTLLNEKGEPQEILVVDKYSDAKLQYDNYVQSGGVEETFKLNEQPDIKILTPEQAAILNKVRILQIGLTNWGNLNEGMVKYHTQNSDYDILRQKYVELEDETDVETSVKSGIGKVDPSTVSLEAGASKETIYILKSLFKVDKDGKHKLDSLGFKERVDFKSMWYKVVTLIGGVKDPQEQYDILKNAIHIHPEFAQLVNSKIPNPQNAKSLHENRINTSFFRDLGRKTKFEYIQDTIMEDGTIEVIAVTINVPIIIKRYEDAFKTDTTNSYVKRSTENVSTLDLVKVLSDFKAPNKDVLDEKKSLDFARAIGLYIDDIDIIQEKLSENLNAISYYGLGYIYKVIKQIAEKEKNVNNSEEVNAIIQQFKEAPINTLMTGIPAGTISDKEISEKAQIQRIVDLQLQYGSDATSLSTLNAKGDTVNPFINDHSMSMMSYALNKAENISDLWLTDKLMYMSYLNPEINSFTNRLQILRNLFVKTDGTKRSGKEIQIFISSGTQELSKDGTNTTESDVYGKNLQEINGMLKGGVIEFMRHGAKSQSFGAKIVGNIIDGLTGGTKNDPKLWIDIDKFIAPNIGENYAFKVHLLEYLAGETDRINKFNSDIDTFKNYKGYNRVVGKTPEGKDIYAGQEFSAFDNVLRKDTKAEILSKVKAGTDLIKYLEQDNELRGKIFKDVKDYFNEQTQINFDFLQKSKHISPDLINKIDKLTKETLSTEEIEKVLVKAYTYNAWVHNFETATLFYGDTVQYDDIHKRNTGASSVGEGFRTDQAMRDFVENTLRPTGYAQSLGKEYDIFKYEGKYNTAIVQDIERTSLYLDKYMIPAFKADYTKRYKNATKEILLNNLPNEAKQELIKLHGKNFTLEQLRTAMIESSVKTEIAPYINMEESDGQGYITFDAYRLLKNAEGNWTDEQEALFRKIVAGRVITIDEITEIFPVYKVQNFGHLANTKLPVNAMHKFSLMPLIPGIFPLGSDLDSLHKQMMKKNVQYMTFGSGSKVGSVLAPNGKADEIYDKDTDNRTIKEDITFTPNTIYLEYLKNVTTMATTFKGKTIYSSQARGIGITGLLNNGELINPDNAPAYNGYLDAVKNMRAILELELLEEIGYEKVKLNDGTYTYKGDLEKFMSIVQKELVRKDVPDHLVKFIGVNPDNTLKFDLSFHPNADTIETLITSMIEKRLVKQKVKGEGFIQVSSAMTNGIWDRDIRLSTTQNDEVLRYLGTNNLPFYYPGENGYTKAMKVALALQGDFKNLLNLEYNGQPIGDIDTLNVAIKDDEWLDANNKENRQAITMNSVRIPVDAISSMEFMEVYHFLNPAAGPIIILPAEIVAKSGTDFDGDKMTTSLPNLGIDGKRIKSNKTNDQIYAEANILRVQGESKKALALIKQQRKAAENDLIDTTKGLLELPDNYVHLIRPNQMYLLKGLSEKLESHVIEYDPTKNMHGEPARINAKGKKAASPTRIFESRHNTFKHEINLDARKTLGPTAIDNKLDPIVNSVGYAMPATYKLATKFDKSLGRYVEETKNINLKTRMFLPHNTVVIEGQERISLSNTDTVDNMSSISSLYSHMMNGLLDAEKDPWVFYIQANPELAPILSHLFEAGVPREYAVHFVSQPLIRAYAEKQRLIGSSWAKFTGNGVEEVYLKQSEAAKRVIDDFIPTLVSNAINKGSEKINITYNNQVFNEEYGVYDSVVTNAVFTKEELQKNIDEDAIEVDEILEMSSNNESKTLLYIKPNVTNKGYYNSVTDIVNIPGVLKDGVFDFNLMERNIQERNNPELADISIATFLHFLELEKQSKGTQALKRALNIDTKTSKTVQEIQKVNVNREELGKMSKIDQVALNKLFNESVLSSFADNQIIIDLILPLFPTRNHAVVSEFIRKMLTETDTRLAIASMYGTDRNSTVKFITNFKNAITNYIYQNSVSDIKRPDGTEITFNDMTNPGDNSFTNDIFKILAKYPLLKEEYLILTQLTPTPISKKTKTKNPQKGITLIDKADVKGGLAEIYYQNLKELGNPNVRKVADDTDNLYISKMFEALPQVSLYTNGQGFSRFGFNAALPFDAYMLSMQKASAKFIKEEMNEDTLSFIFNTLLSDRNEFKNYKIGAAAIEFEVVSKPTQLSTSVESTQPINNELQIGQYVKFNEGTFIVTQINDNGTIQIYNPRLEGAEAKKSVAGRNLEILNTQAEIVNYEGTDYIVTPKGTIISLKSNKIMNWDQNNGNRKAILALSTSVDILDNLQFSETSLKTDPTPPVRLINDEDLAKFKAYLAKANGVLPKSFFTSSTTFAAFYNTATGRKEGAPQSTKWFLNSNNLYDLTDQETGDIYLENVDLATGYQIKQEFDTTPVNEKHRQETIDSLLIGVKDFKYGEALAEFGYDYKDILTNLEELTTQEELNKIIAKILMKLC